jgi:hypothetical protein
MLALQFTMLRYVKLSGYTLREDDLFDLMRRNPGLVSLNVRIQGPVSQLLRALSLSCSSLTDLRLHDAQVPQDALHFLLGQTKQHRKLSLNCVSILHLEGTLASGACASMRILHLDYITLPSSTLDRLLRACPGLITLHEITRTGQPDTSPLLVGGHCHSLQELTLSLYNTNAPWDQILLDVSENSADLRKLHIALQGSLANNGAAGIAEVAKRCPMLEDLKVWGGSDVDLTICALARECTQLRHVRLEDSAEGGFSDNSLAALVRANPELRSCEIRGKGTLSQLFHALAGSCIGLTKLVMTDAQVPLDGLCCLLAQCQQLRALRFWKCTFLPSTEQKRPFDVCAGMRELELYCITLPPSALDCLLRACPGLIQLHAQVGSCSGLTEVVPLLVGTHCPALRKLSWNGKDAAFDGDAVLLNVSENCPYLRELDIGDFLSQSGAGIAAVARRCLRLQTANIDANLTNDALVGVARHCCALKKLDLERTPRITLEGLTQVMQGCPVLLSFTQYSPVKRSFTREGPRYSWVEHGDDDDDEGDDN